MPTDFGDITAYHREEAARHFALAQAARDRQSLGEAEYHTSMAVRWYQAAREQKAEMRQEPVRHIAYRRSNYLAPEPVKPRRASFAAALMSKVGRVAHAIRQSLPGQTGHIEWLSLR
jgi:hypothetical protein